MDEYIFGANILENLTTGMYQDSKVIYREYIQNACDQIDKAYANGLLQKEEGQIKIWLDEDNRTISIEDNATGIEEKKFAQTLANIAYSDKKLGEDKGFRGIGRLCGLAYCQELIFTATAEGEDTISMMKCDAAKMRALIEANERGEKHTASEVLHSIFHFSIQGGVKKEEHWFKVELIGINLENKDLLNFQKVKEYLSFVAPVPYQSTFFFRSEIYHHAKDLGLNIDEYAIYLNGEQILKKYQTRFHTSKGDDEIFDISFKEIYDSQKNLLAWLWIGVSHFRAVIESACKMRGIRLRKENIQIGNEDALQKLFKEDRGNHYFVGEVFAVAKELIPNSQRDYFNENISRNNFETSLKRYFYDELHRVYRESSGVNSELKKIDYYKQKESELKEKADRGDYVDEKHFEEAKAEVLKAKEEAENAVANIEKKRKKAENTNCPVLSKVISRSTKEYKTNDAKEIIIPKFKPPEPSLPEHRVDRLSNYNRKERKLISKIFDLIRQATDKYTSERIIQKIEDGLK